MDDGKNGDGKNKDFREEMQRVGSLVQEIELIADPAIKASTKELVQLLMDLHGAAFDKMLGILADSGEPGMELIDRLGRDPLVSSLLILYGLHPEEFETRVVKSVERMRPQLRKQGCEIELLGMADGVIRVHIETGSHSWARLGRRCRPASREPFTMLRRTWLPCRLKAWKKSPRQVL